MPVFDRMFLITHFRTNAYRLVNSWTEQFVDWSWSFGII